MQDIKIDLNYKQPNSLPEKINNFILLTNYARERSSIIKLLFLPILSLTINLHRIYKLGRSLGGIKMETI